MEAKKSSSKQVVAILLLVIGLAAGVFGVLGLVGGGGTDPYEARKSVVMVYSYLQLTDGQSAGAMGTGFAIGKPGEPVEYIVTNGHVVEYGYMGPKVYAEQVSSAGVQVYFSAAENDYVTAEVVYYSASNEKDIAIIRLPSKTDKREAIPIRDADDVAVGDTAFALGYPGVASQSQQFNTYDEDDITLTKGIISKRTKPAWSSYDAFQMDVYINHGNSGGPLVDERGNLIGINASGAVDEQGKSEGVNFAITSAELIKALRIHHGRRRTLLDSALVCLCVPAHRRAGAHRRHHPAGNVPEGRTGGSGTCRRCRRYGIWKSACKRRPRPCGKTGCAARRDRKILWPEL